jgi:hypothetical protein
MPSKSHVRQSNGSSDRRWVVITPEGQVATVGRASDPSENELAALEQALLSRCKGGWLAIQSHSLYQASFPEFVEVRRLGEPAETFESAVQALRSSR